MSEQVSSGKSQLNAHACVSVCVCTHVHACEPRFRKTLASVIIPEEWFQNRISKIYPTKKEITEKPSASDPQILCFILTQGVGPGAQVIKWLPRTVSTRQPVRVVSLCPGRQGVMAELQGGPLKSLEACTSEHTRVPPRRDRLWSSHSRRG